MTNSYHLAPISLEQAAQYSDVLWGAAGWEATHSLIHTFLGELLDHGNIGRLVDIVLKPDGISTSDDGDKILTTPMIWEQGVAHCRIASCNSQRPAPTILALATRFCDQIRVTSIDGNYSVYHLGKLSDSGHTESDKRNHFEATFSKNILSSTSPSHHYIFGSIRPIATRNPGTSFTLQGPGAARSSLTYEHGIASWLLEKTAAKLPKRAPSTWTHHINSIAVDIAFVETTHPDLIIHGIINSIETDKGSHVLAMKQSLHEIGNLRSTFADSRHNEAFIHCNNGLAIGVMVQSKTTVKWRTAIKDEVEDPAIEEACHKAMTTMISELSNDQYLALKRILDSARFSDQGNGV